MRFNLKLFVLVGVLAGFRDVYGTDEVKNKDDDFIVDGLKNTKEAKEVNDAMEGMRVIKAVYKKWNGNNVGIIDSSFQDQLSSTLVCKGKNVEKVKVKNLQVFNFHLCYVMQQDVEYTVYFIFKDGGVESTRDMFSGCNCLISADLMFFNALNVIDMFRMFSSCSGLKRVYLPVQGTQIKKRCICCGDAYVLWNNREVGGLKPENTVRKYRKKIFSEISTKKN